jgi:hypothetical protein
MKRFGIAVILFFLTVAPRAPYSHMAEPGPLPAGTEPRLVDHAPWDALLRAHVREGLVDYPGMMRDRGRLDAYLSVLADADLRGWSEDERKAFWINAYNARMVAIVLDHWPIESVLDIGKIAVVPTLQAFRSRYRVAGADRSLDDIEHRILRVHYPDARIHAAVNCASISCPLLAGEAYEAGRLDAQLDRAMDRWLADPLRNRVLDTPPRLSKIFDWYGKDFENEAGSVWAYVLGRMDASVRSRLPRDASPEFLDYDWSLNQAPAAGEEAP